MGLYSWHLNSTWENKGKFLPLCVSPVLKHWNSQDKNFYHRRWWSGSLGKGACHLGRQAESRPRTHRMEEEKSTTPSCPLTSHLLYMVRAVACAHSCVHTCTHKLLNKRNNISKYPHLPLLKGKRIHFICTCPVTLWLTAWPFFPNPSLVERRPKFPIREEES